jgi:hypothetical protein
MKSKSKQANEQLVGLLRLKATWAVQANTVEYYSKLKTMRQNKFEKPERFCD